jgi:hypothetical protein
VPSAIATTRYTALLASIQTKESPHQLTGVDAAACFAVAAGPNVPEVTHFVEDGLPCAPSWAATRPAVLEAQVADLRKMGARGVFVN